MSIEKVLDFNSGYGNYSGDVKPTTQADMYRFMSNQNSVLMSVISSILWQPSTAYKVGDVVLAPSLNGYHARCTVAGTSGSGVPSWALGGVTQDGSVTWVLEQQSAINEQQSAAITSATNTAATNLATKATEIANYTHQLKRSTAYAVGDIAYYAKLPSPLYLECTTAGTTGKSEPSWTKTTSGTVVSDGTAKFTIKTVCAEEDMTSAIADAEANMTSAITDAIAKAGIVAGDVSNPDAWWIKLGGTIPLIIQGVLGKSYSKDEWRTITFPISFTSWVLPSGVVGNEIGSYNISVRLNDLTTIKVCSGGCAREYIWTLFIGV